MKSLSVVLNHLVGTQQVSHDSQRRCLHCKQVVVVDLRAAAPHELGQTEQVLQVVARLATAHSDLGADLLGAGRAQVERVVCRGDVKQRLHRWLALVVASVEVHHPCGVAPAHRLTHVQVLEWLLHLSAGHLEGHTPGARLQGKTGLNGETRRRHNFWNRKWWAVILTSSSSMSVTTLPGCMLQKGSSELSHAHSTITQKVSSTQQGLSPTRRSLDGSCLRAKNASCSLWRSPPCSSCTWSRASTPMSRSRRSRGWPSPSQYLEASWWSIKVLKTFKMKSMSRSSSLSSRSGGC